MKAAGSTLGVVYRRVYDWLCGVHPNQRPWHFQWLALVYIYRDIRRILPTLRGRVLDVGCGAKPYAHLMDQADAHIGIDVAPGEQVDHVVSPEDRWPFEDASFDGLIATQVIEHVDNLEHTLSEMRRVVKPGGRLILSFPFLSGEHGAPGDFRRLTVHGALRLLPDMGVDEVIVQGGVGSTLAKLFLNWVEDSLNLTFPTRILKALVLPVWIPACFVINIAGWLVDRIDRTESYYSNVCVSYRAARPPTGT